MNINISVGQVLSVLTIIFLGIMWGRAELERSDNYDITKTLSQRVDALSKDNQTLAQRWGREFAARSSCLQAANHFAGIVSGELGGMNSREMADYVTNIRDLVNTLKTMKNPVQDGPPDYVNVALLAGCE